MGYWLKKDMTPVDLANEAMRNLGLEPRSPAARGGTDGSRLTADGLPTPNLFAGYHNPHGPLEWTTVQDMELAMRVSHQLYVLEFGGGGTVWEVTTPPAEPAGRRPCTNVPR